MSHHTDVLNDNTTETGTVTMKKVQAGEVQGRVDFTAPDRKTITFEKRRVQEYLPKIKTLQVFDLDKHGEQLDKFLMIGFGTSGTRTCKRLRRDRARDRKLTRPARHSLAAHP